jgi:hypothetical protein
MQWNPYEPPKACESARRAGAQTRDRRIAVRVVVGIATGAGAGFIFGSSWDFAVGVLWAFATGGIGAAFGYRAWRGPLIFPGAFLGSVLFLLLSLILTVDGSQEQFVLMLVGLCLGAFAGWFVGYKWSNGAPVLLGAVLGTIAGILFAWLISAHSFPAADVSVLLGPLLGAFAGWLIGHKGFRSSR